MKVLFAGVMSDAGGYDTCIYIIYIYIYNIILCTTIYSRKPIDDGLIILYCLIWPRTVRWLSFAWNNFGAATASGGWSPCCLRRWLLFVSNSQCYHQCRWKSNARIWTIPVTACFAQLFWFDPPKECFYMFEMEIVQNMVGTHFIVWCGDLYGWFIIPMLTCFLGTSSIQLMVQKSHTITMACRKNIKKPCKSWGTTESPTKSYQPQLDFFRTVNPLQRFLLESQDAIVGKRWHGQSRAAPEVNIDKLSTMDSAFDPSCPGWLVGWLVGWFCNWMMALGEVGGGV